MFKAFADFYGVDYFPTHEEVDANTRLSREDFTPHEHADLTLLVDLDLQTHSLILEASLSISSVMSSGTTR